MKNKKLESINSPLFEKLQENKATGLESIYGGIPPVGSGTKTDTGVNNDSKISDMFDTLTGKDKDDHKKTSQSSDTPICSALDNLDWLSSDSINKAFFDLEEYNL